MDMNFECDICFRLVREMTYSIHVQLLADEQTANTNSTLPSLSCTYC